MADVLDFPTRGMPGRGASPERRSEFDEFLFQHRATRDGSDCVAPDGELWKQTVVVDRSGNAQFIALPDMTPYKRTP